MNDLSTILSKTLTQIDTDFEKKSSRIISELEEVRQWIVALFEDNDFSPNVMVDMDKLHLDAGTNELLSSAVRIGDFIPANNKTNSCYAPCMLPFAHSSANAFIIDENNKEDIQHLFQMIACRFMLSLPANLLKFHFVDTYSFGGKMNIIRRLSDKLTANAIVDDEKKLNELIMELEQYVREVNRNQLVKCRSIEEYNKKNAAFAVPYRFVFISHFPYGFSKELAERFFNLIQGGKANKAGIYIFYSIDNDVTPPYGFDISAYMNVSTLIGRSEKSEYYKIENSIFDPLFNETFNLQLHSHIPADFIESVIETINRNAENIKQTVVSMNSYFEEMMQSGKYWQENTRKGVKIPIGIKPVNEKVYFELGGNTADYFAMVGGRPGYGKTVLLHNIICNGSVLYSPKELQFYLIDCKDGVGFNHYKNLPHKKFISINNNLDLILNALQNLQKEMTQRSELFKDASEKYETVISKIEDYREITNDILPRIILIIDEFQLLLSGNYQQANAARSILTDLIKRGRSAGINIIFCTQSYRNVDFDTNLITLRIAFSLEEWDSEKILRNIAAAKLYNRGEAILNRTGEMRDNLLFQGAYLDEKKDLIKYIKFSQAKTKEHFPDWKDEGLIDKITTSDLGKNSYITNLFSAAENTIYKDNRIYLGVPYYIGNEHIYFNISNKDANNIILIGNDLHFAMASVLFINWQLKLQNSENSRFFIIDFLNTDHLLANYYADFADNFDNISYVTKGDFANLVDEIEQELNQRLENDKQHISNADRGKIVLTLSYVQAAKELKKVGWNESPITSKLLNIMKDGSDFGIHLIFYSYTYEGLFDDMFDNKIFNYFEHKIVLKGGKLSMMDEINIETGYGLINNKTHKSTPFMFYNVFEGKTEPEIQENIDNIFSIFDVQ